MRKYQRKVERQAKAKLVWYLSHFPFVREDETTIVPIVMDSAAQHVGHSVNAEMLPGPKLQGNIVDLLANSAKINSRLDRRHLRNIEPNQHGRRRPPLPTLPWMNMEEAEPAVHEAVRLVLGDDTSPFLTQKVLLHHVEMMQEKYPEAADVLHTGMHVDDIMTGANSETEADALLHEFIACLSQGMCFFCPALVLKQSRGPE